MTFFAYQFFEYRTYLKIVFFPIICRQFEIYSHFFSKLLIYNTRRTKFENHRSSVFRRRYWSRGFIFKHSFRNTSRVMYAQCTIVRPRLKKVNTNDLNSYFFFTTTRQLDLWTSSCFVRKPKALSNLDFPPPKKNKTLKLSEWRVPNR